MYFYNFLVATKEIFSFIFNTVIIFHKIELKELLDLFVIIKRV
jgi:hypothetical protein